MKKTTFYAITIFLLLAGCQKEEMNTNKVNEESAIVQSGKVRTLSLSGSIPDETSTRIALTQEEDRSITLTWQEDDQIELCFVQGSTKVKKTVTVKNLSEDKKRASFDLLLPDEIDDGVFDLYGVYGGGGLLDSDPTIAILPALTKSTSSFNALSDSEYTMLRFSAREMNTADMQTSVIFQHVGSLFCLTLKNTTGVNLDNIGEARLSSSTTGWAYNSPASNKGYNLVTDMLQDVESAGNYISLYANGTIATGDTLNFWGWYPIIQDVTWPQLTLSIYDNNDQLMGVSNNVKPARTSPSTVGKCFYFFAVLNDAGFHFTDKTYTAPLSISDLTLTGDLKHADSGDDFIGMVYTKSGNVYYNQAQLNGEWSGEINLGAGSDPRLVVDAGNKPHVVYVDGDKIAYSTKNEEGFISPIYIETNFEGSCSKPDIAIDGSGFAHITYTDTRGNTGAYTNHPDIMYAVNSSGSFIKTLIYNGYYESYGGADAGADYFNKGSRIAVDATGRYFILSHKYDFYKWMNGNDKNYTVIVNSGTANGSGGSTYKYDREDIYDIAFDGTNVLVFYKTGNVVNTAQLTVSGNTISFTDPQQVTAPLSNSSTTPATLLALPTIRVLGGISAGNIFLKYNTEEEVINNPVKSGTVVVATECSGEIFVAYSGTDDIIRLIKRVE